MTQRLFTRALATVAFAFAVSCGGDSTNELNGVGDVPSLDASAYDYSLNDAVQGLTKLDTRAQNPGEIGGFSRAACEGYALKKRLFEDTQRIEGFLCYVKELERAGLGLSIGGEIWDYFAIQFPPRNGEEGPPPEVRSRVKKDGRAIRMDACIPDDNGGWRQEVALSFAATDDGYAGHAINSSRWVDDDGNAVDGASRVDVTIVGTGPEDFVSAEFNAYHSDHPVGTPDRGWISRASFTAEESTRTNSLTGVQSFTSDRFIANLSQLFGQWGTDLTGTVRFSNEGAHLPWDLLSCQKQYPLAAAEQLLLDCVGKCYRGQTTAAGETCPYSHSGIESFDIDNETTPPSFTVIDDTASPYFAAVEGTTLPTLEDVESYLGWIDPWDCEGDFAGIDARALIDIKDRCEPQRDPGLWQLCEIQEQIARQAATDPI